MFAGETSSPIDRARELRNRGQPEKARTLLIDAAAQYRKAGDNDQLARALGIAADLSISLGLYKDAIAEASEALKLRVAPRDGALISEDYNVLGLAFQYLADYPASLVNYNQALANDRARGDLEGEVASLNNIGNVYYFQGYYSDSLRDYDAAMAKIRSAAPASWISARRELTLANLAVLYQRTGQEARALEYYRDLAGRSMPAHERAQLLVNQGVLYRRLGDPVKALELYRSAQQLFADDRDRDGEIGALRNAGITWAMSLNDRSRAMAAFDRALTLARESSNGRSIAQIALYRGELWRSGHDHEKAAADFRTALSIAKTDGLAEEEWKAWLGLGRVAAESGRVEEAADDFRRAIAIVESVRSTLRVPALRSDFLADKRDVYDALIELRLGDPKLSVAEILDLMEKSRAREAGDRAGAAVATASLSGIQRRLSDGTLFVEYWIGDNRAAAVWMTRQASGIARLGDASEIRREAQALAQTISQPGNSWRGPSARLGAILLGKLPRARRAIISTDDVLGRIPLEALQLPGADSLLIEKTNVSYVPAARFIPATGKGRKWRTPWANELVAIANPPVPDSRSDEITSPLPASIEEVNAISKLLPGRSQIHTGEDARKKYLGNDAPLLHLATHAVVDPDNPDLSRILLANGPLFQREVYDLDLRGIDLVTLSACDTARGKFVGGEGIESLSAAFLVAGAAATLTTLWRVEDRSTAAFMQQFYYELARGESKEQALRLAKLRFIGSGSQLGEPRYWAAFVLNGDGAGSIARAVSWNIVAAFLCGLIVVFVVAGAIRAWSKRHETA